MPGFAPGIGGKMAKRGGAREGSGRKKMEGVVYTSIRIDAASWERIPKPKVEYVRQAVAEKLEREEVEARR
jgi:hypothetical protein